MKGFSYLSNVAILKISAAKCIGCGKCIEVCPHQVFSLEDKKAKIVNFDSCMECGACAKNCPASALHVNAGVGCATGLIMEWLLDHRLISSSEKCCS